MGKPSMFSSNYKQQLKKRRLNTILFLLLILCISFFGGKYYLNKNNIDIMKNIRNLKIVKNVHMPHWITDLRDKFNKKHTDETTKVNVQKPAAPVAKQTTPSSVTSSANDVKKVNEFLYTSKTGLKFSVEYETANSVIKITGLKDETNTSDYDISQDKSMIVFDIKPENSIVLCDSNGKFKEISRDTYKSFTTGRTITKADTLATYKDYIWAQKPCFTQDGRVVYISRLPYFRTFNTLYLWSVKLDGSEHKKITKLTMDMSKVSYGGFDERKRLKVIVSGVTYYLDNGSYMLVK